MKRDMDIVRKILFVMEEKENQTIFPEGYPIKISGRKRENIIYRMKIMGQAGLLHVDLVEDIQNPQIEIVLPKVFAPYYSVSWSGHEFLALARDDTVWKKVKKKLVKVGGDIALPILIQLLTLYANAGLGLK